MTPLPSGEDHPLGLEFAMTYRVRTSDPLGPTDGSPQTARQFWQVSEATLEGPRLSATLWGAGIDWMEVGPDGYWRPDVRLQLVTTEGEAILMRYAGLVEQTDAFKAAAEANRGTAWHDQHMRLAIRFETGAEGLAWLNRSLFVAAGRLLGTGHIEYAVCRVT